MDYAPKSKRDDLYNRLKKAWDCEEYNDAKMALIEIVEVYQDKYPKLAEFVSEHRWETLGVHTAAQVSHHKRLCTTNMIVRVNQELKRRSMVRIFPNPASCRRLFTILLKEWHEDWEYGSIYLDMELLEEFEAQKQVQQQESAPAVESNSMKEKRITVA
jgi:transposase-like protein